MNRSLEEALALRVSFRFLTATVLGFSALSSGFLPSSLSSTLSNVVSRGPGVLPASPASNPPDIPQDEDPG